MTLVEVLVASVILGVGVSGLMLAATLGLRNQQRSQQRIETAYFAQEKLAEIESIGPHIWLVARPTRGSEMRGDMRYEWSVQIDEQTTGELFSVQVTVNWQAPGSDGRVEMQTLLNDYAAAAASTFEEEKRKGAIDAGAKPTGP